MIFNEKSAGAPVEDPVDDEVEAPTKIKPNPEEIKEIPVDPEKLRDWLDKNSGKK